MVEPNTEIHLDQLADEANFGVSGGLYSPDKDFKFSSGDIFRYYMWEEINPTSVDNPIVFLAFSDPHDVSGAKIYKVSAEEQKQAGQKKQSIDLGIRIPHAQGKEVVKILQEYIEMYK